MRTFPREDPGEHGRHQQPADATGEDDGIGPRGVDVEIGLPQQCQSDADQHAERQQGDRHQQRPAIEPREPFETGQRQPPLVAEMVLQPPMLPQGMMNRAAASVPVNESGSLSAFKIAVPLVVNNARIPQANQLELKAWIDANKALENKPWE